MIKGTTFSPLVRRSFLEILDRIYRIYRDNFLTFAGLSALIIIPISILSTLIGQSYIEMQTSSLFGSRQRTDSSVILYSCILAGILPLVQSVLINGLFTYATSESHLGRKLSILQIFSEGRGRLVRLALGFFLFYFLMGLGLVVLGFILSLSGVSELCALFNLALIPLFGALIYIAVCINAFIAPILILEEGISIATGLNRAFALAKSRFWSVFGLMLAIGLINLIITTAFTAFLGWLVPDTYDSLFQTGYGWTNILNLVVTTSINILLVPVHPIGMTLIYYDIRIRLEGLDLALEALDKPNPRPRDVSSPSPQTGFTRRDWINIAILIAGAVVIYLLFAGILQAYINYLGL